MHELSTDTLPTKKELTFLLIEQLERLEQQDRVSVLRTAATYFSIPAEELAN